MKRTVMTMIAGLACITTAFAQISEERVPAKGFAMFSAKDTFRPYEFTRHAIGENDIQIEIQESATVTCTPLGMNSRNRDYMQHIRWFRDMR